MARPARRLLLFAACVSCVQAQTPPAPLKPGKVSITVVNSDSSSRICRRAPIEFLRLRKSNSKSVLELLDLPDFLRVFPATQLTVSGDQESTIDVRMISSEEIARAQATF